MFSTTAILAYVAFSIAFWLITPKCNNDFTEFSAKSMLLFVLLCFIRVLHWLYLDYSFSIRHADIPIIQSMEFEVSELKIDDFSVDLVPNLPNLEE